MQKDNPLMAVDYSFYDYVTASQSRLAPHLIDGVPDYAYREDFALRKHIKRLPGFYPLAKALTNQYVPLIKQTLNLKCLKVGPSQFSDVYDKAVYCARILGIGIPTVFIDNDPSVINAFTVATEDEAPMICISSGLLERFSEDELLTVIGHECGHIHNEHSVFDLAAQLLIGAIGILPKMNQALTVLSTPLRLSFLSWSRAAEITCDRAGIICSNNKTDSLYAEAKLLFGASQDRNDINIEAIFQQYDSLRGTPVRLIEIESTHPIPARRILAEREFLSSEILYQWRPDWEPPETELLAKKELDDNTAKFVSIAKNGKRKDSK
ncbi:MAG: M48 family metallopeptidase [Oscillospiraceae bacterium]|jgi:Zn-dependent protease with chaperone function|nr:M48 family metallopeptidase [Oscillospiraceae bacterium]